MSDLTKLTIDGVEYEVESLSDGVKSAIGVYNKVEEKLRTAQLDVVIYQSSLQQIGQQIAAAVKNESAKAEASDNKEEPLSSEPV